jgi:NAD(P)-dependent dehydrogenase (short-subunit alcohol dehydrogenase family)
MPLPLAGRVALVTGASRGIGATASRAFDEAGARVILCSRDAAALRALASQLNNDPVVAPADLSLTTGVRDLARLLEDQRVSVDILVNNAGALASVPAYELPMSRWDLVQNLNLRCAFELSRELAPAMAARGWGRIINVASILALVADTQSAAYVASKAGLVGLTRALATEWALDGVGVNALCPGWVKTEFVRDLVDNPAFDKRVHRRTPADRWLVPEDLVGPLMFLASPASDAMTGQTLVVDGGLTATW